LYEAYGAKRGASEVDAPYRYTGQRWEENDALDIYYYKARWYDPQLGRFLQPDPFVPEAGNPQTLNRYSYVNNNPLGYTDPTGLAADAGGASGGRDPWEEQWHWNNRWYEAHGYFWKNGGWNRIGAPQFRDEAITDEVIAEAGIQLFAPWLDGGWSWADKKKVAYAVARYGQKLKAGVAGLNSLLGGYAGIYLGMSCFGSACAPPYQYRSQATAAYDVLLPNSWSAEDLVRGAQIVAHELAHVIDWRGGFSARWASSAPLTWYAQENPNSFPVFYPPEWDLWAEAVSVWIWDLYNPHDPYSYYVPPAKGLSMDELTTQMGRVEALLNGWY